MIIKNLEKLKSNVNYNMKNNLFSYNNKVYKTNAAMKRAITADKKRAIKQVKQEQYAQSEKKAKKDATIDYKKNFQAKLQDAIDRNKRYQQSKQLKTYHISANIGQKITFKNRYDVKSKSYKQSDLKQARLKDKVQMIRETEIIKARNYDDAKEQFLDKVELKFGSKVGGERKSDAKDSADYYDIEVDEVEFLDEVEMSGFSDEKPSTMFLTSGSPIEYNFTTQEKEFLKNTGFCVEDNLLGIYSNLIKKFTFDNIVSIATEFYKKLNIVWNRAMGYSTDCIIHICQHYDISCYAYDIMNVCFKKNVCKSRHYPALFFYAVNNHMYLVKDENQCKSLTERAKDTQSSFKTSLIEELEATNLFEEYPIYENIDIKNMKGYSSSIFIYSREKFTNINDIFETCIGLFGVPVNKTIKASKSNITKFEYKLNGNHYIIVQDPNDISIITWKKVQQLCKKHDVPFKNQTFLSFIKQKRSDLINEKSERHLFSEQERRAIYDDSDRKCTICKEKLQRKYELDHIKPLVSGGTNDLKNIQLLCKSCHKKKSHVEKEDGSYIRIIETESTFNNQLLEIMSSDLCERYAFIENLKPLENKKDDIDESNYTIENSTNKNIYCSKLDKYDQIEHIYNDEITENYKIKNVSVTYHEYQEYLRTGKCKYDIDNKYGHLLDIPIKLEKQEEINKLVLDIYNIDIKKCRKNNLYYSKHDLPVFTVMDSVKVFNHDDTLETGIYYIETKEYFPLRGNGWYSLPMIEYCLENQIINLDNIKYCVQCLVTIPANYYNEFIDFCYDNLEDNYKKLSINMMIGGFKPNLNKHVNWSSVCITSSTCEAYHQYLENKGCFIEILVINNIKYFHVYKEILHSNIESEKPIYDQILDLEAIELHKLSKLIESKNGVVLDLNTDCVTCSFKDNVFPFELDTNKDIIGYYYDDKNTSPLYKLEDKNTRLQVERKASYKREHSYYFKPVHWTNKNKDVEDNNFKPLVNKVINSNKSFFITGPAGTGKSQLIRDIKTELDNQKKTYKCLAPTNLAALNIKGTTIHKFVSKIKKMDAIYKLNYDYIFIDEVSMIKEVFYKFFVMLKRIKPNVKLIFVGDYNQLSPIDDRIQQNIDYSFDYKNSVALKELCDYNILKLTKCRRSDDILYNMCKFENIDTIDTSVFGSEFTRRHLAYTNKKRIEINKICMDAEKVNYHGKKYILEANFHDCDSQEVTLYPKLPIICKKNDETMELINNEQFYVSKLTDTSVRIKNENKTLIIDMDKFQEFFYVAYCITIHKSQGQTFDFPYTIHQWNRLDKKLKYVALTRSSDIKLINII